MKGLLAAAWLAFLVCGCSNGAQPGSDPAPHDLAAADGAQPSAPITAPEDQWTWVDFPDSSCDDGSTTGIGVYRSSLSQNLLVFFEGGGACWSYQTCVQLMTATRGPFGKTQFDALIANLGASVFNRAEPQNPFKDWSYVFVPYCTGDLHAGNNIAMYTGTSGPATAYHHAGHTNLLAYLKRLTPTFPAPPKLVVSGSSAGGYGALLNYSSFRAAWPQSETYLLDDSGPTLEASTAPATAIAQWVANWHLDELLVPQCGNPCTSDLSLTLAPLTAAWPSDRMALLSSLQDMTIASFSQLSGAAMQAALLKLAADDFDPTAHSRYFFIAGNSHTMLGAPGAYTSVATPLWTWLTQLVGDDPAWGSTKP